MCSSHPHSHLTSSIHSTTKLFEAKKEKRTQRGKTPTETELQHRKPLTIKKSKKRTVPARKGKKIAVEKKSKHKKKVVSGARLCSPSPVLSAVPEGRCIRPRNKTGKHWNKCNAKTTCPGRAVLSMIRQKEKEI
jgi:hypothetical protein